MAHPKSLSHHRREAGGEGKQGDDNRLESGAFHSKMTTYIYIYHP